MESFAPDRGVLAGLTVLFCSLAVFSVGLNGVLVYRFGVRAAALGVIGGTAGVWLLGIRSDVGVALVWIVPAVVGASLGGLLRRRRSRKPA